MELMESWILFFICVVFVSVTYLFFMIKFVVINYDTKLLWYKVLMLLIIWPLLLIYAYQVLAVNIPKLDQATKESQNENGE